jgi:hypothetical protein
LNTEIHHWQLRAKTEVPEQDYGAVPSALIVNENTFSISISPAAMPVRLACTSAYIVCFLHCGVRVGPPSGRLWATTLCSKSVVAAVLLHAAFVTFSSAGSSCSSCDSERDHSWKKRQVLAFHLHTATTDTL